VKCRERRDKTNLLQFHQGLLLNTILFKVILRSIDDFLDDLFVDLALQNMSVWIAAMAADDVHAAAE
jgi:hypothetical protein